MCRTCCRLCASRRSSYPAGAARPCGVFRAPHRGSTACRASRLAQHLPLGDRRANEIALTETRRIADLAVREPTTERVLSTVLFTDLVGSTERAVEAGDEAWADILGSHHALVRRQLDRFRGQEIDNAGDGFLAAFDGPARAILCARAITEALGELGLEVRSGLHTGECELVGEKLGGIAVHIGARVAGSAQAGEVLVSSTVKDLVAGSGIEFEDRGEHTLKGLPGHWRLYALR